MSGLKLPFAILSLFTAVLWLLLSFNAPSSVYFKDSGEFLISASFLDIAHPAGFPIYSQMANLFTLIPIGPLAWRVHLFSIFCALAVLLLSGWLCFLLVRRHFSFSKFQALAFAPLPAIILLSSQAFLRQALSAEVYLLNAALCLLLVILFLQFENSKDCRFLLLAAFLSGLALACHVSSLLVMTLGFFLVLLYSPLRVARLIPSIIVLGLCGLTSYTYLPIRALNPPPLNSGNPSNSERLVEHLSDMRDIVIRPEILPAASLLGKSSTQPLYRLRKDLQKVSQEISPFLLLLSVLGIGILYVRSHRTVFILAGAALVNWFFFLGWSADPWMLVLAATALFVSIFWARLVPARLAFLLPLLFLFFHSPELERNIAYAKAMSDFDLPAKMTKNYLSRIPAGSAVLLESSWFKAKYLHNIEGYRNDLVLSHLPQVIFPRFYEPVRIQSKDRFYDSSNFRSSKISPRSTNLKSLSAYVQTAAAQAPLTIEPNASLNDVLRAIARLKSSGLMQLEVNQPGLFEKAFVQSYREMNNKQLPPNAADFPGMLQDTYSFLERRYNAAADLLARSGSGREAAELLASLCIPRSSSHCSPLVLNNLASHWMALGQLSRAKHLLEELKKETAPSSRVLDAVEENLMFIEIERAKSSATSR